MLLTGILCVLVGLLIGDQAASVQAQPAISDPGPQIVEPSVLEEKGQRLKEAADELAARLRSFQDTLAELRKARTAEDGKNGHLASDRSSR